MTRIPECRSLAIENKRATIQPMKILTAIALLTAATLSGVCAQESDTVKHLKAVAGNGDYKSAHDLATAYATGDGVKQDLKAADFWYSIAAYRRDEMTNQNASIQNNPWTFKSASTFGSYGAFEQSNSGPSVWKKTTDAVSATSSKVGQFVSDHLDDIFDIGQLVLDKYYPGLIPPEDEGGTGKTRRSGQEQH